MRALVLALSLGLFSCKAASTQKTPGPAQSSPIQKNPWNTGVFQGEGRQKLALLPDGTMIFPPLYLGTYTLKKDLLTFLPSTGEPIQGKLTQDKEAVVLAFQGENFRFVQIASFSSYPRAGTLKALTLESLLGQWRQVAHAGSPLSDWQAASDALGPSLASEETLAFSLDGFLTQTVGESSRKERFSLEGQTLVRTPEGAGYTTRQELRLYEDRLELGPNEAPDIYKR